MDCEEEHNIAAPCTWIPMDDGVRLNLRRWKAAEPKAVLHIIHGMAEHSLRYDSTARRLAEEGIEVWAADQRGHGETARYKNNPQGRGGLLGHSADSDGFSRVTADIDILNREIRKQYPDLPIFLLGHSWGSFIAQNYIENYDSDSSGGKNSPLLAGCVLSGTRGPNGVKITINAFITDVLAFFGIKRRGCRIAKALTDGSNNKPFKPNRTDFDWLSRDEKAVDSYIADPLCGFLCSLGFYRDMARALKNIHKPDNMRKIRRDLPLYIFSGGADPVGDMGASTASLAVAYRHIGITDLESVIYPDARHEPLNETNRQEVTANLVSWLRRRAGHELSASCPGNA